MRLFTVPLAPNPTKVMLYIAEREVGGASLGVEEVIVNTLKGRHKAPEHLARNPFGTLPTLELEDGTYIVESLAIIQYLEDRFPHGVLVSGSAEAKGRARDIERIVDLRVAGPMAAYVHATKSPLGLPSDAGRAAELEASLQTPLDYLEALLADGRPLLTGEHVSIADCTLQAALQFLRFIEADLFEERSRLRCWDETYRARPAAKKVLRW